MSTSPLISGNEEKVTWHVTVSLTYEDTDHEVTQDRVKKIMQTLKPLTENGSGIRQVFLMRLPERV